MSENPVYGNIEASRFAGLLAAGALADSGKAIPSATTVPFRRAQGDFGYSHYTISSSPINNERRTKQQILFGIIAKSLGPNSIFLPKKIDTMTTVFSILVIQQLPDNLPLPKIAPDVDGGLLMVWEGQRTVLATVEGSKLHVVVDPGTLGATHFDSLMLTGRALPPELLNVLATV